MDNLALADLLFDSFMMGLGIWLKNHIFNLFNFNFRRFSLYRDWDPFIWLFKWLV